MKNTMKYSLRYLMLALCVVLQPAVTALSPKVSSQPFASNGAKLEQLSAVLRQVMDKQGTNVNDLAIREEAVKKALLYGQNPVVANVARELYSELFLHVLEYMHGQAKTVEATQALQELIVFVRQTLCGNQHMQEKLAGAVLVDSKNWGLIVDASNSIVKINSNKVVEFIVRLKDVVKAANSSTNQGSLILASHQLALFDKLADMVAVRCVTAVQVAVAPEKVEKSEPKPQQAQVSASLSPVVIPAFSLPALPVLPAMPAASSFMPEIKNPEVAPAVPAPTQAVWAMPEDFMLSDQSSSNEMGIQSMPLQGAALDMKTMIHNYQHAPAVPATRKMNKMVVAAGIAGLLAFAVVMWAIVNKETILKNHWEPIAKQFMKSLKNNGTDENSLPFGQKQLYQLLKLTVGNGSTSSTENSQRAFDAKTKRLQAIIQDSSLSKQERNEATKELDRHLNRGFVSEVQAGLAQDASSDSRTPAARYARKTYRGMAGARNDKQATRFAEMVSGETTSIIPSHVLHRHLNSPTKKADLEERALAVADLVEVPNRYTAPDKWKRFKFALQREQGLDAKAAHLIDEEVEAFYAKGADQEEIVTRLCEAIESECDLSLYDKDAVDAEKALKALKENIKRYLKTSPKARALQATMKESNDAKEEIAKLVRQSPEDAEEHFKKINEYIASVMSRVERRNINRAVAAFKAAYDAWVSADDDAPEAINVAKVACDKARQDVLELVEVDEEEE